MLHVKTKRGLAYYADLNELIEDNVGSNREDKFEKLCQVVAAIVGAMSTDDQTRILSTVLGTNAANEETA